MKLRPLHDRVIVKRVENETKTASGIVIPDSAAEVGDRVLFGKYSGQTVKVDGDELLVMKEDDLFAVVEK